MCTAEDVPKQHVRQIKAGLNSGLTQNSGLTFSLIDAPAVCQREVNKVLADLPSVLVYLDDMLVFNPSTEEHAEHPNQA